MLCSELSLHVTINVQLPEPSRHATDVLVPIRMYLVLKKRDTQRRSKEGAGLKCQQQQQQQEVPFRVG